MFQLKDGDIVFLESTKTKFLCLEAMVDLKKKGIIFKIFGASNWSKANGKRFKQRVKSQKRCQIILYTLTMWPRK